MEQNRKKIHDKTSSQLVENRKKLAQMDARDIDLILDQIAALAAGCSRSAVIDLLAMDEMVIASTLHHYTVGAYETTAQDLDALSQADTEAGLSEAAGSD